MKQWRVPSFFFQLHVSQTWAEEDGNQEMLTSTEKMPHTIPVLSRKRTREMEPSKTGKHLDNDCFIPAKCCRRNWPHYHSHQHMPSGEPRPLPGWEASSPHHCGGVREDKLVSWGFSCYLGSNKPLLSTSVSVDHVESMDFHPTEEQQGIPSPSPAQWQGGHIALPLNWEVKAT